MKETNIVIISAVYFPRNSPRANRATELSKELAKQGNSVTVFSVLGDFDYSKFELEYGLTVKNLSSMKFVKLNSSTKYLTKPSLLKSYLNKLLRKLIEFPDIELSFKVIEILKQIKNVDLLITIAAPHSIHWGAAYASKWFKQNNINTWVADCGDPYMGNKFSRRFFYFKYLEKWFCRKVDYLTIPIKEAKQGYYKEFHDKIRVIPQGFNFEDIQISKKAGYNNVITFVYAGVFYKGIRDPRPFLDYLCELDLDFKFIVFTKSKALIENYKIKLLDKLEIHDYIPRLELLKIMSQADFLVNFENNTDVQSPSKLIDYALSKRPILSVKSSKLNKVQINDFLNEDYSDQLRIQDIKRYNIRNVANKFIQLIK